MIRTKILLASASYIVFLLAACGGDSNNGGTSQNNGSDSGTNQHPVTDGSIPNDASDQNPSDKMDSGDNPTLPTPPKKDAGTSTCKTSCADDDCGPIFDRCTGAMLDCGDCDTGLMCGALVPSKCGMPKPTECQAKTAAEVCGNKCGSVSDGCNSVIMCNADNGGVTCQPNQLCVSAVCKDPPPSCVPQTCDQLNHKCGVLGDGCGNPLDCGVCASDKECKYDSAGNTCVMKTVVTCTALTAASACASACGIVGDGCGNQIDCEANAGTKCPNGTTCGGGGMPGACGSGMSCAQTPVATACAGKCGDQADGCGGIYTCSRSNGGQTCDVANGETCGGNHVPNQCGKPPCMARTSAQACPSSNGNKSCGVQPDGCGQLIDCGGCTSDQQCGLNEPSICGALPVCQPTPASTVCAGKCGSMPDGCGGVYQCSSGNGGVTCTGNEYCGANNMANKCGIPPVTCFPKTCLQLGHSCGLASDGCGHVLNCWTSCNSSNTSCMGDCGNASSCLADSNNGGAQSCVAGSPTCTGSLCGSVPNNCASNSPTTLTGTVRTPGRLESSVYVNQLPVPNALVYIPAESTATLPDIFEGVAANNTASCGRCDDEKLVPDGQSILAAAVTDYKGDFVLQGRVPVGVAFKLVIKVGKWRRVVSVPTGNSVACDTRALSLDYTRLAAFSTDGQTGTHLPKISVSTGDVDAMECVLRGIGISESEFTVPSGTGRIHMYRANGTKMPGSTCSGTYSFNTSCAANSNFGCVNNKSGCSWNDTSVADTTLYASQAAINTYDMVVFDCEGNGHHIRGATPLSYLLAYANNGGRVFASHWSYEWLANNGALNMASAWTNTGSATTGTGFISLPSGTTMRSGANPVKSLLYRDWLDYQGALTGTTAGQLNQPATPQMSITDPRDVAGATVGTSTDEWMYRDSSGAKVQQLSFNTPYGAADTAICGRIAFSAFHVAASSGGSTLSTNTMMWPRECHSGVLTPQEKTLAFMLFDLGACVSTGDPPQPPMCVAKTAQDVCPNVNDACGFVSDGCGGVVDCAGCSTGFYCDGNLCRPQECAPASCSDYGYTCGDWPDGCGGTALNSQGVSGCGMCTGGQTCGLTSPGICGGCVKIAMATACPTNSCGTVSDGCGGTYDCGVCAAGVCGGAGPNRCGQNPCSPTACPSPKSCGLVADGCGSTVNCGPCTSPDSCGGGGAPNICGHPTCTAKTLQQACNGLSCGWVSDGCGGAINCGTCPNGGVCGGNGPNKCGDTCTPTSCSAKAAECGSIGDECGGLINCGPCPSGKTCGAMAPNKCGTGPSCTKLTCGQAGASCGLIGDGCGGALDCGACVSPQTCGGAGMPNKCGTGTTGCNKLTCSNQTGGPVQCGAASDGCGGLIDCGVCPSGSYCANGTCMVSPG